LFVSHQSRTDLLDLYCCLLMAAQDCNGVRDWLDDERSDPVSLDQLQFGFGCASPTIQLPNFVVRQHAAAFMPALLRNETESAVHINPLTTDFFPRGAQSIAVPAFDVWIPEPATDWRIHVHPAVKEKMQELRSRALPNETGGYLYGYWDATVKTVSVVFASDEPPDTKASPAALELGRAGRTDAERRLIRASASRLTVVGSWHSHTGASSALSPTDLVTMVLHAVEDRRRFVPTLGVVVAKDGFTAHLEV
jgi:hypothetical protein